MLYLRLFFNHPHLYRCPLKSFSKGIFLFWVEKPYGYSTWNKDCYFGISTSCLLFWFEDGSHWHYFGYFFYAIGTIAYSKKDCYVYCKMNTDKMCVIDYWRFLFQKSKYWWTKMPTKRTFILIELTLIKKMCKRKKEMYIIKKYRAR